MKKFLQKKLKNEKGMTLIELLAVIVIIAIIAAIAIPAIGNIIENSRVGAAKSDALNAFSAAQLYLAENSDAFAAGGNGITADELMDGGFIDDLGGFGDTGVEPSFATVDVDGNPLLSGTAVIGGVTVQFASTPRATVEAMPNSAGNGDVAAPATVTITR